MKDFVPVRGHVLDFKELADPSADVLQSPFDLLVNQTQKVHKSRSLLPLTLNATVDFI